MIQRPVIVVAPPRSGGTALTRSLARSPGVFSARGAGMLEGIFELEPENREWDSNRLTAADLQPRAVEELRSRLKAGLVDSEGNRPGLDASGLRWVDGQPRNALRVPFLAAVAPDAQFVYIHREPADTVPAMLAVWRGGRRVSYPQLPEWSGPPWSLPLVPGWRELAGRELPEIVTEQWLRITKKLLDDLEALAPERWCVTDFTALLNDPQRELERICEFVALEASEEVTRPLRSLRDQLAVSGEEGGKEPPEELAELLPRTDALAERSRELLARPITPPRTARWSAPADSPLRSVYTQTFPEFLNRLSSSMLVSTYQTGKLICARYDGGQLNTHFRDFPRPMGLAVAPGRIAIGTRAEVIDYRDFPAVAPKVEPRGRHDACFLPRNKHFTGDIRIHEIAFAQGELWLVATNFSCLATLDAQHSFIPRWKPPFISQLTSEDRCHLNGLCVIDDEPRFVTALGETDVAGGWRENKASGGVLVDVETGETVLRGLSMPHSPRWYDDRMWVLESGKGTISVADLDAGTVETVAELPGFTRGLLFAGGLAFVGLSQVRETATFGGLPLMERLDERLCGVWAVNPQSGQIVGFLRFEELVQEVFDVALLPGLRYPEIAEEGSDAATNSFVLPEAEPAVG
ncbi:MAG TPA: TIGR03032 family protein [Solirubrobacterales bacterium]|nr:TIGR03032 family protein [Solirubrobacterales bacterium]